MQILYNALPDPYFSLEKKKKLSLRQFSFFDQIKQEVKSIKKALDFTSNWIWTGDSTGNGHWSLHFNVSPVLTNIKTLSCSIKKGLVSFIWIALHKLRSAKPKSNNMSHLQLIDKTPFPEIHTLVFLLSTQTVLQCYIGYKACTYLLNQEEMFVNLMNVY